MHRWYGFWSARGRKHPPKRTMVRNYLEIEGRIYIEYFTVYHAVRAAAADPVVSLRYE